MIDMVNLKHCVRTAASDETQIVKVKDLWVNTDHIVSVEPAAEDRCWVVYAQGQISKTIWAGWNAKNLVEAITGTLPER